MRGKGKSNCSIEEGLATGILLDYTIDGTSKRVSYIQPPRALTDTVSVT